MKESNLLVDNVAMILPVRVILQNTEVQFMKESNILADNVANNLLNRVVLKNI